VINSLSLNGQTRNNGAFTNFYLPIALNKIPASKNCKMTDSRVETLINDVAASVRNKWSTFHIERQKVADCKEILARQSSLIKDLDDRIKHVCVTPNQHHLISQLASSPHYQWTVEDMVSMKSAYDFVKEMGGLEAVRRLADKSMDQKPRAILFTENSLACYRFGDGSFFLTRVSSSTTNADEISLKTIEVGRSRSVSVSDDNLYLLCKQNAPDLFGRITANSNLLRIFMNDNRKLLQTFETYKENFILNTRAAIESYSGCEDAFKTQTESEKTYVATSPEDGDDVQIVGELTVEQRNRVGFANAIVVG